MNKYCIKKTEEDNQITHQPIWIILKLENYKKWLEEPKLSFVEYAYSDYPKARKRMLELEYGDDLSRLLREVDELIRQVGAFTTEL